jgi:pimeloyl-ACP methyl ester carboxylesterase
MDRSERLSIWSRDQHSERTDSTPPGGTTIDTIRSDDGTTIAYEVLGAGPPVVIVAGANCDAAVSRPLAEALAEFHTVVNYDRRGRGGSADTAPYSVAREVEDLRAMLGRAGGTASIYGHSSGAALALHAAAAGLSVDRLVLHEPPYVADDAQAQESREYAAALERALSAGRRSDAAALFLRRVGAPAAAVEAMQTQPWWGRMEAFAPTLAHDSEVMGFPTTGGLLPVELVQLVRAPTLVLSGANSPEWMTRVGGRIAELIPRSRQQVLPGQGHVSPPEVVVPLIVEHLAH